MGILFMKWLILLGYGVDNTHSYYDCLDSHGMTAVPHSPFVMVFFQIIYQKNKEKCLCVQGSCRIFAFIALILI